MQYTRSSGILLHPTSLPGPDGIGDLGPEAYRWIDFLSDCGCGLWQMLPLGPTGYGDSPYQCFSAFAGNPYLISPARLIEAGILKPEELYDRPRFSDEKVEYARAIDWKNIVNERAVHHFSSRASTKLIKEYADFQINEKFWLDDYALFMSIKSSQRGAAWNTWPAPLRKRESSAIRAFTQSNSELIETNKITQFFFFKQWYDIKEFAHEKGIKIIGDIPIFIAYDSADSWSHPELFTIDEEGQLTSIAGVPPDYFSTTGQLWGNPLYEWEIHRKQQYSWWIERLKSSLNLFDMVRLDHFRGFAGYWKVPAGMPTAEIGEWEKGPGEAFFESVSKKLGDMPIIAEDLGVITPDVVALREHFNFPGMKIFQFAFSNDAQDPFLPHNYPKHCIAYTGTHDNDTTLGWYMRAPENEKDFCRRYLARSGKDISWDMIRAIWSSVAVMALAPFQDILERGSEARMNFPGRAAGNWTWRFSSDAINDSLIQRLKEMNLLYGRSITPSKT